MRALPPLILALTVLLPSVHRGARPTDPCPAASPRALAAPAPPPIPSGMPPAAPGIPGMVLSGQVPFSAASIKVGASGSRS